MDNLAEEYKKCAKDFVYFCEKYVKIQHSTKGVIPFKLYDYQKRVIQDYKNHRFNIILKFRQGGLTTTTVIWSAWKAIFNTKNNQILVVSISDREAKHAGKIVDVMVENLPDWLKPSMPTKPNAHEKKFLDSGGSVSFYTVKAARSRSLSILIIDEAAHIQNMDEHWSGLFPTLATGGSCIVISTPRGMGNWFSEEYHKGIRGEGEFHVIEIDVSEHPDYNNQQWLDQQLRALGPQRFGQEILRQFLAEGDTFISNQVINDLDLKARKTPPISKRFPEWDTSLDPVRGALWIWKMPEPGKSYTVSVDSATGSGDGTDNSAFVVIEDSSCEQVAEFYSNKIPPFKFAQIVHQVAVSYNWALLVVENNGTGFAVLDKLEKELYYNNLYGRRLSNAKKQKFRYGININKNERELILDTMKAAILNDKIKIKSSRLVKEFTTFILNPTTKRVMAAKKKHDDLIMSLALALYVLNQQRVSLSRYDASGIEPVEHFSFNKETRDEIKRELEDLFNDGLDTTLDPSFIMDSNVEPSREFMKYNGGIRENDGILKEFGW